MSNINYNIKNFIEVVSSDGIKLFNISSILSIKPIGYTKKGLTKISIKFVSRAVYIGYVKSCDVEYTEPDNNELDIEFLFQSIID